MGDDNGILNSPNKIRDDSPNSIRRRDTINASTKKQNAFTHSPTKKGNA